MDLKRVFVAFGTRPEAIKMAPIIKEFRKHKRDFHLCICTTAQHREMLDQVISTFDIEPDVDLNLMTPNQTLSDLSANALMKVTSVLKKVKPDLVLVQGDTTTAMIASMAAFYLKIPVGHVEAGLRTDDRYSPFPEEVNRRLISVLSTFHFAPTKTAVNALLKEGYDENRIYMTGNTIIDAILEITMRAPCAVYKQLVKNYRLNSNEQKLILVTAHRRESFGKPMEEVFEALSILEDRNRDIKILYPVHYNPNVKKTAHRLLRNRDRIILIDPLDYETFVHLMKISYLILTDSGGIQEEAPSLGKPVLVMRDVTERPEAVEAGTAKMVGTSAEKIVIETESLLRNSKKYKAMASAISPYGDGKAASRIAEILLKEMNCDMT